MTDSVLPSSVYPSSFQTALVSVTLSGILVPLNSSMIAVALPEIMRDFHIACIHLIPTTQEPADFITLTITS